MSDLDSLIDSKISLITHDDKKYDGTLFSINATESSMVLKDVRCLGTEDRVTDPAKKVLPSNDVVAFVTFPGQDIKDLIVHDPTNSAPPTPPPAPKKESKGPPPVPTETTTDNKQQRGGRGGRGSGRRQNRNDGSGAGTGTHLLKMRERKSHGAEAGKDIATAGEFDFQAGLSVFKKEDILAKVAVESTTDEVHPAPAENSYKKDDFFDSLSCDLVDREAGRKTRMSASEERNLNQDTFGAIALQNNYRRYHGRGGRGRATGSGYRGGGRWHGGRGRGGGRGRNHYSHNNHNNTSSHDNSKKIQQP